MSIKNKYDNYLFYLCTAKTSPIKYLIELMRNLFPEGVFKCDKQAIKYKNITKSRDVFMDTILNASSFEEYFCPNEIEIALNMENLFKIVKGIDSNDTLKLYVLKDKPNKLVIHTYNKEENTASEMVSCPYFTTNILPVTKMLKVNHSDKDSFVIYMCVKGSVTFSFQNDEEKLTYGETILVPACIKEFEISTRTNSELLEVFIK